MYSFGVCLWEMLHGRRPWAGFSAAEIMFAVAVKQQPLPFSLPPTRCPPQLARLVMLCMDHDPIRRPSALEAVRELALLQQRLFPVLPPPALTATSGSQGSGSEPNNSSHNKNNSINGTSA
ncbi:hypothetical protein QJQ45_004882 [Haematococcus lacustris]|nr:hypothetical protein QJQ45_004882 [Haematococcus lacustris]